MFERLKDFFGISEKPLTQEEKIKMCRWSCITDVCPHCCEKCAWGYKNTPPN